MTAPERAPILLPLRLSRREALAVILFSLAMATLFVLPYLLGHWLARPETVFTGLWINVEDGSYLSAIAQGRQGSWLYRNLFTTEAHAPVFIQVFYLALGHLGRWLGLSTVAAWHLGLWLADFVLLLVVYRFIAAFLPDRGERWTAYLLAVTGAGFDWFRFSPAWERLGAADAVPLDLFMPEAHLFFSGLTYPHFAAGIALILFVILCTVHAFAARGPRFWVWMVAAGLANIALGIVYPFLIFLTAVVLSLFSLHLFWRARRVLWRIVAAMAVAFLLPLPLFTYYAAVLLNNEVFRQWNAQAVTLSPQPLHYLLTYAPYLLLGLAAGPALRAMEETRKFALLFIWIGTAALLLYAPINPQRRFVEGLQIPLAIVAAVGLCRVVLPWFGERRWWRRVAARPRYSAAGLRRLVLVGVIGLVSLASIYTYIGALFTMSMLQPYPLFRPAAEQRALAWLQAERRSRDVVLSRYWTGSYLPSQTGDVAYVGQRFETIDFESKREQADRFFDAETGAAWRKSFLRGNQAAYIFAGPHERALGGASQLDDLPFLEPVFHDRDVTVYSVNLPQVEE